MAILLMKRLLKYYKRIIQKLVKPPPLLRVGNSTIQLFYTSTKNPLILHFPDNYRQKHILFYENIAPLPETI